MSKSVRFTAGYSCVKRCERRANGNSKRRRSSPSIRDSHPSVLGNTCRNCVRTLVTSGRASKPRSRRSPRSPTTSAHDEHNRRNNVHVGVVVQFRKRFRPIASDNSSRHRRAHNARCTCTCTRSRNRPGSQQSWLPAAGLNSAARLNRHFYTERLGGGRSPAYKRRWRDPNTLDLPTPISPPITFTPF